jgi:hypothetical protein
MAKMQPVLLERLRTWWKVARGQGNRYFATASWSGSIEAKALLGLVTLNV